eukprot:332557-Amorphochlora_amoeboformis.AAC.1
MENPVYTPPPSPDKLKPESKKSRRMSCQFSLKDRVIEPYPRLWPNNLDPNAHIFLVFHFSEDSPCQSHQNRPKTRYLLCQIRSETGLTIDTNLPSRIHPDLQWLYNLSFAFLFSKQLVTPYRGRHPTPGIGCEISYGGPYSKTCSTRSSRWYQAWRGLFERERERERERAIGIIQYRRQLSAEAKVGKLGVKSCGREESVCVPGPPTCRFA